MKRIISFLLVSVLTQVCCVPAFGWGQKGHRIIAKIAYDHLNCKAKRTVDKTLGKQGMIYWTNWADEIKSDTIYPDSQDWHYQDFPAGMSFEQISDALVNYPAKDGNMFRALDSLENVLRETIRTKQAINPHTLRFFIHLYGDLYCPMHMAHVDDRGGNAVKMKWFGANTNLHSVWDGKLLESQGYSYSEYAELLEQNYDTLRTPLLRDHWTKAEMVWQTYQLTSSIYKYQPTWDGNTYHYIYRWHEPMEKQLYIAGIRLARVLNSIFK